MTWRHVDVGWVDAEESTALGLAALEHFALTMEHVETGARCTHLTGDMAFVGFLGDAVAEMERTGQFEGDGRFLQFDMRAFPLTVDGRWPAHMQGGDGDAESD